MGILNLAIVIPQVLFFHDHIGITNIFAISYPVLYVVRSKW